jgi:hypothetical protein
MKRAPGRSRARASMTVTRIPASARRWRRLTTVAPEARQSSNMLGGAVMVGNPCLDEVE